MQVTAVTFTVYIPDAASTIVTCLKAHLGRFHISICDLWFATVRVSSLPTNPVTVAMRPNGAWTLPRYA